MANMKIEKITLEVSQEELILIKMALNYHVSNEYDNERKMQILLADLEG